MELSTIAQPWSATTDAKWREQVWGGGGAARHMPRIGQICMWQAQATVFLVESTIYTACIPYIYSKIYGFGQPYTCPITTQAWWRRAAGSRHTHLVPQHRQAVVPLLAALLVEVKGQVAHSCVECVYACESVYVYMCVCACVCVFAFKHTRAHVCLHSAHATCKCVFG